MTDTAMNTVSDERLAHYIEYADLVGDNGTPAISTGELAAMARELQSLRASIPGDVGVKGLEWLGEEGSPGKDIRAYPTPEIQYTVRHLDMDTFDVILNTDLGSKWFRNDGQIHASYAQAKAAAQADYERRILSALDLSPAEGEPVGLFRKTDGAWKHVPDEWADHPNVQPLYAAPSNPVISDEWQPIETAPKTSSEVLLWGVMRGRTQPWKYIGSWFPHRGEGWWVAHGMPIHPTHWMPLPAAPAALSVKPQSDI